MTEAVRLQRQGRVLILIVDQPPVNALGAAVRAGLAAGLAAALADPGVGAIVIRAEGPTFSAGADIREFGQPPVPGVPLLPDLCRMIEDSPKPVIAAVQGAALGGGLELALAAHVRLAMPEARFGLPEVNLGLLPGAGGTQRVPRLVGAAAALRLMLTGRPVTAAEALGMGLVDAVVEDRLPGASAALAEELAREGRPPRRTRDREDGMRDRAGFSAAVAAARAAQAGKRLPAPGRIVDCVEAALLLPFEQGMTFERAAFEDLRDGPESAGLRHAFLAEKRAGSFAEAKAAARPVAQVGLIGLGRTGAGIAFGLLRAGLKVTAVAKDDVALVAGLGRVAELQEAAVAAGEMTGAARDAEWDRLTPGAGVPVLAGCDLVIEALPEDADLKAGVLTDLARRLKPGAVIATSVSWLDPAALAEASGRAADVVGLHLCPPVDRTRLAEIAVGPATLPEAVATVATLVRRMGKQPLRVAASAGLVGNRVMAALRAAADQCLDEGATPRQVDAALRGFGFAMGPYEALDLAGLERAWAHRQRAGGAAPPSDLGDLLVETGRLGQETGRGYYVYDQPEGGREDPEVLALLAELRRARGHEARDPGTAPILRRCLTAATNEGARVLGEGLVPRASDIDVAMIAGYGWPRWEGGPMFWADRRGLIVLRAEIRRLSAESPMPWQRALWQVAPMIDALIREGRTLASVGA